MELHELLRVLLLLLLIRMLTCLLWSHPYNKRMGLRVFRLLFWGRSWLFSMFPSFFKLLWANHCLLLSVLLTTSGEIEQRVFIKESVCAELWSKARPNVSIGIKTTTLQIIAWSTIKAFAYHGHMKNMAKPCVQRGCLGWKVHFAIPPACYRSLSGPWGPKCPGVSPRVSPKMGGVRGSVRRSVQKVSRECPRSVPDTFLTLRGHSRDTFWTLRSPGPEGPREHPVGHSLGHPPFSGTLSGTLRGHFGPEGPERLLSQAGGIARFMLELSPFFSRGRNQFHCSWGGWRLLLKAQQNKGIWTILSHNGGQLPLLICRVLAYGWCTKETSIHQHHHRKNIVWKTLLASRNSFQVGDRYQKSFTSWGISYLPLNCHLRNPDFFRQRQVPHGSVK